MTKSHFTPEEDTPIQLDHMADMQGTLSGSVSPYTGASQFLPTSKVRATSFSTSHSVNQ